MIQKMLASWSLVPLPCLKPAWTYGSSWFTYCQSLAWRILSFTLLACERSAIFCAFFGIAFIWDWNENWPFPVLWPQLSFPYLLTYWVQHFHSVCTYICKKKYYEILAHVIIEAENFSNLLHASWRPGKARRTSEGLRVTKPVAGEYWCPNSTVRQRANLTFFWLSTPHPDWSPQRTGRYPL